MKNQFKIKKMFLILMILFGTINATNAQTKHAIEEGKYIIKCASDESMVLDGTNVEKSENVKLKKRDENRKGQVWKVSRVNGPLGGYIIKCTDNSLILDGDGIALGKSVIPGQDDGKSIKVQLWERNGFGIRTNQEWYIGKSDGFNTIYNVMNDKKFLDAKDDISDGSRVKLYKRQTSNHDKTQMWVFEKVN